MKRIIDYKVLNTDHVSNRKNVEDYLAEGWQPFGSAFMSPDGYFYQAFVRYKE